MENITNNLITNRAGIESNLSLRRSIDFKVDSEAVDKLISEGGENFYNYVARLGLVKDSDLIVLSSLHNYYYDSDEMNNVKTVVNLKELNQVKQLKSILHSHLNFLPPKCNFVGCFVNNEKVDRYALRNYTRPGESIMNNDEIELGIVSRFPLVNMLYSMMDLRTNMFMSERSVTLLLRVNGFKVLDMTDLNGFTFFHAQKVDKTFN